jgi:tetratricopeptide (TPR) repeat protein
LLALLAALGFSCVSVRYLEDLSAYETTIKKLERKIQADPADAQAWRDLGIIYFQARQAAPAETYLQKAYAQNSKDPKTLFYLGLALELQNKIPPALQYHEKYTEVPRLSPYRRLMAGRYRRLTLQSVREEMRALLQQEQQLSESRLAPQATAVFPLRYLGNDPKFASLGKGFSEMLLIDLGRVAALKLVERIRLQTLLDEMALAQSERFDRNTAPRFGKLLGAGRLIAGSYNVLANNQLQVEVLSWDTVQRSFPDAAAQSEALENLFKLEKDVVFAVIANMGIELTPAEREKIQFVPTKNLQAFMAYCQGLEKEDAGQFGAAAAFYSQAKQLDPSFELAGLRAEAAQSLSAAGGSPQEAAMAAQKSDPAIAPDSPTRAEDLLENRLRNSADGVGANFVPGQDSRKPAAEASIASDLKTPPAPPRP